MPERVTPSAQQGPDSVFPELAALRLASPDGVEVTFVPEAGMVGSSLKHDGEELLGMRDGLGGYVADGTTFGIPLLAPWANRLARREFDGVQLVTHGVPGVRVDPNGLPIHGLMAGCDAWHVVECFADDQAAHAAAELVFDEDMPSYLAFPFAHRLRVALRLARTTLTVATTITAVGNRRVPIAFGWHPYFAPPGAPRRDWRMSSPFAKRLGLDRHLCPTGEVEPADAEVVQLGDPTAGGVTYDSLFADVADGTVAWVEGGGRRISVSYDLGYPYAVLFAPPDQDLVAIEPMAGPTDPLAGRFPIRVAGPGESATSVYSIVVSEAGDDGIDEAMAARSQERTDD